VITGSSDLSSEIDIIPNLAKFLKRDKSKPSRNENRQSIGVDCHQAKTGTITPVKRPSESVTDDVLTHITHLIDR